MAQPFTPAQFKFLEAAFYGLDRRNVTGGKWLTNDKLVRDGLVEWNADRRCVLTLAGLRAYVDMCERRDAASGCMAYMERAQEARARLAEQVSA